MKIFQHVVATGDRMDIPPPNAPVQLVLAFGGTQMIADPHCFAALRAAYPAAIIVGCSTAGNICGTEVSDDTLVVTALAFEHTEVAMATAQVVGEGGSFACGEALVSSLPHHDLRHVLVLSDGLAVNGTELVRGITSRLPAHVTVTGGLSADGERFKRTLVYANAQAASGTAVAIGLYGGHIRVGYSSRGGWAPFGPERVITRSSGNVLFDLDGKPALELYKCYLGEHATKLPAAALLFPLLVRDGQQQGVVRTILAIDEVKQSMTFAGDMPEGHHACLMAANIERLIDGAHDGAAIAAAPLAGHAAQFALLISCVGRKLVLTQQVEEEVECVRDVLGPHTALAGFYSYGEIAPHDRGGRCELHNQTMTITTFTET